MVLLQLQSLHCYRGLGHHQRLARQGHINFQSSIGIELNHPELFRGSITTKKTFQLFEMSIYPLHNFKQACTYSVQQVEFNIKGMTPSRCYCTVYFTTAMPIYSRNCASLVVLQIKIQLKPFSYERVFAQIINSPTPPHFQPNQTPYFCLYEQKLTNERVPPLSAFQHIQIQYL